MDTLVHLGIPQELQNLIFHCISSASMNINWNGNMAESSNPGRGLRQGDPLSPYLFVLCIERLGHMIKDAVTTGEWAPYSFGRGDCPKLSHICFADDLILVAEVTETQVDCSCPWSPSYSGSWLSGWKAKTLSFAGRVTLAQTSLVHIPGYVLQSIPIPVSVCQEVEQICRNFIWGTTTEARKVHLIAWDKLCHPKSEGGLRFRNLKMLNKAHMMKLSWQILTQPSKLWVKILKAKYNCGMNIIPNFKHTSNSSPLWRAIVNAWDVVKGNITWVIRDGVDSQFWRQPWIPNVGALEDHIAASIPKEELNFPVNNYASDGLWKWDKIRSIVPNDICDKIAVIKPPSQGAPDFPCWKLQPGEVVAVSWKPPPDEWHKVNVDGSFNTISGSTACGGLIRNQHGIFVKGFYSKIGSSNAIWAEMWVLRIGIRIAQNLLLPKVVFEMDSKVIVNMVTSGHTNNAYLSPLLGEVVSLLQHPNWETSIAHVYREANRCADFLTNKGHSSSFEGDIVNLACHSLQAILYDDFRGASLPRLIR
ncbi:hypothetical protein TSUD_64920 [Trifolium subterraneum]|uniref:Uncharacterized protein n=1 Tax=Trifolium subterraneum TaxID=3900 RepID=A0A2Z6N4W3_TRISU|nr:hypothetical protein TSUD_64920 [Trifolium subterraneum]